MRKKEEELISVKNKIFDEVDCTFEKKKKFTSDKTKAKEEISSRKLKITKLSNKLKEEKSKALDMVSEYEETDKLADEIQEKEIKKELKDSLLAIKKRLNEKESQIDDVKRSKLDEKEKLDKAKNKLDKAKNELMSTTSGIKEIKKLISSSSIDDKIEKHKTTFLKCKIDEIGFDLKSLQSLDICFVVDCTGSMGSYITAVKENVCNIIKETQNQFPGTQIRLAFLAYRDINDHDRFEINDFTEDAQSIINFAQKLQAQGGADGPEDVNGALQKSVELSWNSSARLIFHIADAPCHNQLYHSCPDDFPKGYSDDKPFENIFEELLMKKIVYAILQVNDSLKSMISKFREHYLNLRNYFEPGINVFHYRKLNNNPANLFSTIISSINHTMTSNIHSSLSSKFELKSKIKEIGKLPFKGIVEEDESECDDDPPMWNANEKSGYWVINKNVQLVSVDFSEEHKFDLEVSLNKFKIPLCEMNDQEVWIHPQKANQGSFNKVFYAKLKFGATEKRMMIKFPKEQPKNAREYFENQLKLNTIGRILSKRYNEELVEKTKIDKGISFVDELIYKKGDKYGVMETFIEGEYTKYTNNATYITSETSELHLKIISFGHWSYQHTKGNIMITDLQGSQSLLTDPTLHTLSRYFRSFGDFGSDGYAKFFIVHKCNKICKRLGLKEEDKFGKASYLNKAIVQKKCQNKFCVEQTKNEYCENCLNELNLEKIITAKCKCGGKIEYKKLEYVFKGKKIPNLCASCKVAKSKGSMDVFFGKK